MVTSEVVSSFKILLWAIGIWESITRWRYGDVKISEPADKAVWNREWIPVKGNYSKKIKGHYWLMSSSGSKYWPQGEVDFKHDGTWSADLNLGLQHGPKTANILLVWVDATVNALLHDIKRRNFMAAGLVKEHNLPVKMEACWSPFELKTFSRWSFSVFLCRAIQFPEGEIQKGK